MIREITSSANEQIKLVRSLARKSEREKHGLYFIEGLRFVEEALKSDNPIQAVFLADSLMKTENDSIYKMIHTAEEKAEKVFQIPDRLMKEIADTETPQGILAVLKLQDKSPEDLWNIVDGSGHPPFLLLLDSVRDPGNLGTIMRTADACGVDAVIMSKGCVDIYNPKTLRSTMGSVFHVPFLRGQDMIQVLDTLMAKGITTVAGHLDGRQSHFDVDLKKSCALIIGNEANGISEEVMNKVDIPVRIPMPGRSESLNASVAAAVLMYEVVRQRITG